MRMCFCFLDCHEAGPCCYLVIHIENLLHRLQLFYFNLWPIYWLSFYIFVLTAQWKDLETSAVSLHISTFIKLKIRLTELLWPPGTAVLKTVS
jgi:hypothetical protein